MLQRINKNNLSLVEVYIRHGIKFSSRAVWNSIRHLHGYLGKVSLTST